METKSPAFYSVILAGGRGERLWPYSRPTCPKQLLKLSGEKTLLEHTIDRCRLFSDFVWVITSKEFYQQVSDCVGSSVDNILVEPYARNTGPAIAYASQVLQRQHFGAQVGFFPADHYISDPKMFAHYIREAIQVAEKRRSICLLGLWPTRPSTEYGYIEADADQSSGSKVLAFHEKPDKQTAQLYINDRNKFWNMGIFIGVAEVFAQEIQKYASEIWALTGEYDKSGDVSCYEKIAPISVDYMVMEKSKNLAVIPASLEWSDIGSLSEFLRIRKKLGVCDSFVSIDSHNNFVDVKGKFVTLIGVDNVYVIEQGNFLIVANQNEVESICSTANFVKEKGYEASR